MHTIKGLGGVRVPAVGLATERFVGADGRRALTRCLEAGVRHLLVTAGAEAAVAVALGAAGVRRADLFVALRVDVGEGGARDLDARIAAAASALGGPVDVALAVAPLGEVTLDAAIDRLRACRDAGYSRAVGVGRMTERQVERALRLAPISCCYLDYNPMVLHTALRDRCRAAHVVQVSAKPFAGGAVLRHPDVVAIARRLGVTPAQVVLRWLVQQQGVAAVVNTTEPERLAEALSLGVGLDQQDMASISSLGRQLPAGVTTARIRAS